MAESPKQTQKKITSFTSDSPSGHDSSEPVKYETPKKSPKKKSKRKLEGSSEMETPNSPNYTENARENLTSNGDVNSSSPHVNSTIPASAVHVRWTFDEESMLYEKVGEYLESKEASENSKKKCYFLKDIEWEKIPQIGEHTAQEAKARFIVLSNRVRKMRTASEILEDMKTDHKKGSTIPSNRKRKAPVDPDLPRKPITSYFQYIQAKKPKVLEKHPDLNITEVVQKLGKRWRNLPDEKKQKYSEKWHEEMIVYNQKMLEYLKNHHPDVEPPLEAFDLWAIEESKKIKSDRPEMSEKKLKKKLKRRWENMEGDEKKEWDEKEKKEVKKYKKRIVAAEKKAASKGT